MGVYSVERLLAETRRLAAEYRRATGKTLAVSGEIAISDVIRLLELEPAANEHDCDAVRRLDGAVEQLQVKGRVIFDESKGGHRLGQLKLDRPWDKTVLVLMDEDYEPFEIYEATRPDIEEALRDKAANKRGVMSVAQFKIIAELVWARDYTEQPDAVSRDRNA